MAVPLWSQQEFDTYISNSYKLQLRKSEISSYFRRCVVSLSEGDFYHRAVGNSGSSLFLLGLLSVFRTGFRNHRAESRVKTRDSRSIRLGNAANEPGCKALQSAAVHGGIL